MSEISLNKYRVGILLRGNGSSDDDWNNCQSAILTTFFSVRTATSSKRSWTDIKLAWCKTRYCTIMSLHKHIFPSNIIWLDTYARWYSIFYYTIYNYVYIISVHPSPISRQVPICIHRVSGSSCQSSVATEQGSENHLGLVWKKKC